MTTRVVAVEILPSAHKHGISDDDIRHAFESAVASITVPDQPDFSMIIGPDETGRLLEPTAQGRPTMTTKKHPRDLTADEADALVSAFDDHSDDEYSVTDAATLRELRAAAAARREADARIEAAALAAHRAGLSWGAIGAQLGMTRQGARQRFERFVNH